MARVSVLIAVFVILGAVIGAYTNPLTTSQEVDGPAVHDSQEESHHSSSDEDHAWPALSTRITQYMHTVMEQVREGHVTQAKVNDWKTRINHALQTGSLSQDKYHAFIQQVKAELMSQSVSNGYCTACLFWVG